MTINKFKTLRGYFDTYDNFVRRNPLNYHVCINCGSKLIAGDDMIWVDEEGTFCDSCYWENRDFCSECENVIDADKMVYHVLETEENYIEYVCCSECDKKHKAFLQTVRQNFSYEIFYLVKVELYKTVKIKEATKKLEELTTNFINQLKAQ